MTVLNVNSSKYSLIRSNPDDFLSIDFMVDTRSEVMPMLRAIRRALVSTNLREFLRVGPERILHQRMEGRFASEGDAVVGKWAPLRWSTQRIRALSGYYPDHPINVRTGQFKTWLTRSPGAIQTTKVSATLTIPGNTGTGELQEKLITAQLGRRTPSPTHPRTAKRPVLGTDFQDLEDTLVRFRSWFAVEMGRL